MYALMTNAALRQFKDQQSDQSCTQRGISTLTLSKLPWHHSNVPASDTAASLPHVPSTLSCHLSRTAPQVINA